MEEDNKFEIDAIIYTVISNHSVEVSRVDKKKGGDIIISETVEHEGVVYIVSKIGMMAFFGNTVVNSVTLPNSVNVIDEAAFSCCEALVSVNIPDGVKQIAYETFYGCSSLKSLFIPDSVRGVEERGLWNCSSLETLSIPKHLLGVEYPKILPKRASNAGQCRGMKNLRQCLVRCPSGEIDEFDVED